MTIDTVTAPETRAFEADVSKLLHMMVHSVYSDRDVFLRELISNAADACEKLRYEAISNPALLGEDPQSRINIRLDKEAGTLVIEDNGIGMTAADVPTTTGMPNNGFEGMRFLGYPVFESLVLWDLSRADTVAGLKPGLATSWKQDPKDAATWIFTLRRDVKFGGKDTIVGYECDGA